MDFLWFGIVAYLLGSIPTAVWLGRVRYGIDVRKHGSHNAGATNTFRVLGKKAGSVVLFVDVLKGAIAVLFPYFILTVGWNDDHLIQLKIVCGIVAVIGHIFPLYAQFNGGKGVATSLGVILGIHPLAALICIGIFLLVFVISKYVSLGVIFASISFPLFIEFVFHNDNIFLRIFSIILSVVVLSLHHKNIGRLIHSNENKMNLFDKHS